MSNSIVALATAWRQQQLVMDVGMRLTRTALDAVEDQGAAVVKLLESAQIPNLKANPHLGSIIDVLA